LKPATTRLKGVGLALGHRRTEREAASQSIGGARPITSGSEGRTKPVAKAFREFQTKLGRLDYRLRGRVF